MDNEKIRVEVKADEDSILITASKPNAVDIRDIPCSDAQCLADIQEFLDNFSDIPIQEGAE